MLTCFHPVSIKRPNQEDPTDRINVPCGKCEACRLRYIQHWKYRAIYEVSKSKNSYFITLTYNDDVIPYDENTGAQVLVKAHYVLFLKKLRHYLYTRQGKYQINTKKRLKMRYIMAGEYGSKTNRPHFHAILIDVPWNGHENDHLNYTLEQVVKAWEYGFVKIGTVQPGAVDYVVSYIMGKVNWQHPYQPPFMRCSHGIGKAYVNIMKAWHLQYPNERTSMELGFGKKVTMPRYILDKIFDTDQKAHVTFIKTEKLNEIKEQQLKQFDDDRDKLEEWHQSLRKDAIRRFGDKKNKKNHCV